MTGDGFGVLLEASRDDAVELGERLRGRIAATPLERYGGGTTSLTASIGVAVSDSSWYHRDYYLLTDAYLALGAAKATGRDRVVLADDVHKTTAA
jgi:GGDEF domain-containing protein